MAMAWTDHQFAYDSLDIWGKKYSNCTGNNCKIAKPEILSFEAGEMWTPELTLYNAAGEDNDFAKKPYFTLYDGGYLYWFPLGLFTTSCSLDMSLFPFDHQHCD